MSTGRIRSAAPITLTVAIAAVLAAYQPEAPAVTQPSRTAFTPEEVFAALMLKSGPATVLLPKTERTAPAPKTRDDAAKSLQAAAGELEKEGLISDQDKAKLAAVGTDLGAGKTRPADTPDADALTRFVTDEINRRDATFFNRFKVEVTSGDQSRVQAVMADGARLTSQILLAQLPRQDAATAPGSAALARSIAVNANTLVNVDTAINVNVAYNVDTVKNLTHFWKLQFADGASRLRNEMAVNQITQNLRGLQFR